MARIATSIPSLPSARDGRRLRRCSPRLRSPPRRRARGCASRWAPRTTTRRRLAAASAREASAPSSGRATAPPASPSPSSASAPGDDQTALLRESLLLKAACAGNPFVVGSHGLARDPATLGLCLVMDCGGTSLDDALLRLPAPPSEATVCAAMWQLLTGLKKMHDAHIIHRDIKPDNILVGDDQVLRFCDFGLAVYMAEPPPYNQAGTLWYMAPEMLMGKPDYDALVDTWSLGCVMAELINGGLPLFEGFDYKDQLCDIFKVLGVPDEKAWPWFSSTAFAKEMAEADKHNHLRELFPEKNLSKNGFEVLSGLLTCNPDRRLTAAAALRHPWFNDMVASAAQSGSGPL